MTTNATPNRGTIDAGQFGALCNLFHTTHCERHDPTPQEIGDIVYHGANMSVCDHSRLMARAVMAYLGLRFEERQPRHEPGSGCRFADEQGNCDFHDNRDANELVNEVKAAMLNGKGSLEYVDAES